MITIIAGTNRSGSNTLKIANYYLQQLTAAGETAQLFDLQLLTSLSKDDNFIQLEKKYLIPIQKFIIITPEYNGTFSGILKLMIDNSDVKQAFNHKKIALTGVASGRAGNLRGLDQLTNCLHYLKAEVMPNKLPISQVHTLLNPQGVLTDDATMALIETQITQFLNY